MVAPRRLVERWFPHTRSWKFPHSELAFVATHVAQLRSPSRITWLQSDIILEHCLTLSSSLRGVSTHRTRRYLISDLTSTCALVNPLRRVSLRSKLNTADDASLLSLIERTTAPKSRATSSILVPFLRLSHVVHKTGRSSDLGG